MLTIDTSVGSREFYRPLKRLGVPCQLKPLKYGDFAFWGNGPDGDVRVGIERKRVDEILDSIGYDNRLTGHQLPGMLRGYDVRILLVEGYHKPDPESGILTRGKWEYGYGAKRHLYENFEKFLCTIRFKGRIVVTFTTGKVHTRFCVAALYRWYQKRWKDHKSLYTIDETKPDGGDAEEAIFEERLFKRRVLAQLPGVGWVRSAKVDQYFDSLVDAWAADVRQWNEALGIRGGTKTARGIVAAIRQRDSERGRRDQSDRRGVRPLAPRRRQLAG